VLVPVVPTVVVTVPMLVTVAVPMTAWLVRVRMRVVPVRVVPVLVAIVRNRVIHVRVGVVVLLCHLRDSFRAVG